MEEIRVREQAAEVLFLQPARAEGLATHGGSESWEFPLEFGAA
jgi:hypothetical protein